VGGAVSAQQVELPITVRQHTTCREHQEE
jgi:hypothetical protein